MLCLVVAEYNSNPDRAFLVEKGQSMANMINDQGLWNCVPKHLMSLNLLYLLIKYIYTVEQPISTKWYFMEVEYQQMDLFLIDCIPSLCSIR